MFPRSPRGRWSRSCRRSALGRRSGPEHREGMAEKKDYDAVREAMREVTGHPEREPADAERLVRYLGGAAYHDKQAETREKGRAAMTTTRTWSVEIFLDEHEDQRRTRAEARLHTQDRTVLAGQGVAVRHPSDREVPEIGDELAAARALADLAHRLMEAAAADIEQLAHTR
jgi:hypothetical protein